MLSAQSTDIQVNKVTAYLFTLANTPHTLLKLGEGHVKKLIMSLGLFNTKAQNIIKTCELLLKNHKGEVPTTLAELEQLPGVGRKTANVILNTLFDEPVIAVDTHVFRVSKRLGLSTGNTPLQVEIDLINCVPHEFLKNAHHWLVLHGRYVCTARKPKCNDCIIAAYCQYDQKTI